MGHSRQEQSPGPSHAPGKRPKFHRVAHRDQQDHRSEICAQDHQVAHADQYRRGRITTLGETGSFDGARHTGSAADSRTLAERGGAARGAQSAKREQCPDSNMAAGDGRRGRYSASRDTLDR